MSKPSIEITHPEHGHVATFYPLANPLPLVSYTALVWWPLASTVHRATSGAKYGEPGYGLGFDEQLPAGATSTGKTLLASYPVGLARSRSRMGLVYAPHAKPRPHVRPTRSHWRHPRFVKLPQPGWPLWPARLYQFL